MLARIESTFWGLWLYTTGGGTASAGGLGKKKFTIERTASSPVTMADATAETAEATCPMVHHCIVLLSGKPPPDQVRDLRLYNTPGAGVMLHSIYQVYTAIILAIEDSIGRGPVLGQQPLKGKHTLTIIGAVQGLGG
jgi:hypothetical protein